MINSIENRIVQSIYAAVPELKDGVLLSSDSNLKILIADSLDLISIIFQLEQEFGLGIQLEEVLSLKTVGEFKRFIEKKLEG